MKTSDVISRIIAREVLDSRGNPTVEVEVHCQGGAQGLAIVPAGASTGRHEAVELRDGDPRRFAGQGVRRAVANIHQVISQHLLGRSAGDQQGLDRRLCELDGTPNKSVLGANAILGVSLACAHAAAAARGLALWQYLDRGGQARMPMPMINLISGGLHAGGNLDFQDFLLMPISAHSYSEALVMTVAVYRALAVVLSEKGYEAVLVGDEGGFGPKLRSNVEAVEIILEAMTKAGLEPGKDAALALDVASSHFFSEGHYHLKEGSGRTLTSDDLVALLEEWVDAYPIQSIEDGMAEDDWEGWQKLTQSLGKRVQLIGDDLFATNLQRLSKGINQNVANCVLVKINQIGTLTETLEVIQQAKSAGYRTVISARSGETEDTTIADLAVGTGAGQIKIGSIVRSERLAKYNQLLRIEEQVKEYARWAQ